MKRTVILTAIFSVVSLAGLFILLRISSGNESSVNFAEARKGDFEITVTGTGEFIAEHVFDIMGPEIVTNQNFRASHIRVQDIVPEGTVVKKGDYVATLDRTNFENTLRDEINNLNNLQAQFEMKIIDTSVVLNTLRNAIKEQVFVVEEAKVNLEQSVFDPPAMQRQARMDLERAQRQLEQQQRIYNLKYVQAASETRNLRVTLENQRKKVNDFREILASFTVTSPIEGMIVYKRDRMGNKIKAGSVINPFNPVVASIPDMSSLHSRIFISETDVNKVKPDQEVEVTVDAFNGKKISGVVASVAKIGEKLSNSDSKVFEVLIRLKEYDPMLVPSMTTGNRIIINTYKDV
ncbi:MAG: efflux RND transporter periplasmic adaptor subunit, partial [Bacteroidales bacterium]|nr:efflux RND transporter periplasmic adaptor subunit [Bacteroidales bacterium]